MNEEAKATESPEDKFTRLATIRTRNALKQIKLIGNLSSSSYKYSDEQAEKIISSLRSAVDEIEGKFQKGGKKEGSGFSL